MPDDSKLLDFGTTQASPFQLELRGHPGALAQFGTPPLPLIDDDYDLVPLLRQASNEELAPLVDFIIKKGGVAADLPQTQRYIQYSPNHQMYADDIAAEIQIFGANSIATFARGGKGRKYRDILVKAAKRCGIKSRPKDSVEDIEIRII